MHAPDARRVLIVDDNADQAQLASRALRKHRTDLAVTVVRDGIECLEALAREPYTAVLLDYRLPRMNGLEVLREVRSRYPSLPVVMVTGQGDERVAVEAMTAGAVEYVAKTWDYLTTLPTVVDKAIRHHALAEENVRLLRERDERLRHTEMLLSVSRAVGSRRNLAGIVGRTMRALVRGLDADVGTAWRLSPCGAELVFLGGWRVPRDVRDPALRVLAVADHPVIAHVVHAGGPIHTGDSQADPLFDSLLLRELPHRSVLIQPVRINDDLAGFFAIAWTRERHDVTPEELRLADGIARQAAMAMHNAQLFTESETRRLTAEALSDAAAAVLQSLDAAVVSERIAEGIRRLLGTAVASVHRVDPDSRSLVMLAAAGASGTVPRFIDRFPRGVGLIGLAAVQARPLASADILADPRITYTEEIRARVQSAAHHAVLAVPLLAHGTVVGMLTVADHRGRVFQPEDLGIAQAFADQAALALQNVRLYEQAVQQRREADVIAEVAGAINAALDLDTVLVRVAGAARELCGSDLALVTVRAPGADRISIRHGVGLRTGLPPSATVAPGDELSTLVNAEEVVASLRVPVHIDGVVEGLLYVANRAARQFTERDHSVLRRLSDHAAIALRNVALFRREQAARAAAEGSEQRFRDLVSDLDAVVWEADAVTGRFTFVSRYAELALGYSESEWLIDPQFWERHLHPVDREPVLAARRLAIAEGRDHHLEYRLVAADGRDVWFRDRVRVLGPSGSRGPRLRGVMEDITTQRHAETALRRSEEQLRHAQKMEAVGRLAGGVAHDFNNLLAIILCHGQLLGQSTDDPTTRTVAETVVQAAERGAALTRQLLAFGRRQVLQPKVVDLNTLVSNLTSMLCRLVREDVELATVLGHGLGHVRVDPSHIDQVIVNLVVNARDAMPHGGSITIETAHVDADDGFIARHPTLRTGAWVALTVRDTGCGMVPEIRERIFEPFFTTKEPGKGTGLGLSTVYGIVEQHGGVIEVESEPDAGTIFTIYLPEVEAVTDTVCAAPRTQRSRGGGQTVLVVEDEQEVRRVVGAILDAHGYTVLAAPDGLEALALSLQFPGPIDLLLADVVMPMMNGRELARRLTAERPDTKVLYMSGYLDEALGDNPMDDAVALLEKPFTPDGLITKVREVLEGEPTSAPQA